MVGQMKQLAIPALPSSGLRKLKGLSAATSWWFENLSQRFAVENEVRQRRIFQRRVVLRKTGVVAFLIWVRRRHLAKTSCDPADWPPVRTDRSARFRRIVNGSAWWAAYSCCRTGSECRSRTAIDQVESCPAVQLQRVVSSCRVCSAGVPDAGGDRVKTELNCLLLGAVVRVRMCLHSTPSWRTAKQASSKRCDGVRMFCERSVRREVWRPGVVRKKKKGKPPPRSDRLPTGVVRAETLPIVDYRASLKRLFSDQRCEE